MPKGLYTQAIAVLLEKPLPLQEVRDVLWDFQKSEEDNEALDGDGWAISGPGFSLMFDEETNGVATLDIIDRTWPDDMGDPQQNPMVFMAWSMGNFGPGTFPGSLERACEHAWSWQEAGREVPRHKAFIRLRMTYVAGRDAQSDDQPVVPEDYDVDASRKELEFLDAVAQALLTLPGAVCYFNPSGEVLLPADAFEERVKEAQTTDVANLSAWSNIRFYKVSPEWYMMDSVGNLQFEVPDMEVCIPARFEDDLSDFDMFIRNVSWYLMNNPGVIQHGHTAPGPGDLTMRAHFYENSLLAPPRQVILWLPADMDALPADFPERQPDTDPEEEQ